MPQYDSPSLVTQFLSGDILLFWKTASGGVRTIIGSDLAVALQALMSFNDTVSFVSGNITLTTQTMVVANSAAPFTITLPASASNAGKRYTIVNKGAGVITVARSGADTIGGATSLTLAQYHGYDFKADGVDTWYQIGQ